MSDLIYYVHLAFADPVAQQFSIANAQIWLCEPQMRKNDLCIIGKNHRSNGIQTEIVIHVLPESCPDCGHCDKDPVVASRATARYIYAKYHRGNCQKCPYKADSEKNASEMPTDIFAAQMLQGQSWQTVFLLAQRDRNMKVRFFWNPEI